MPGQGRYWLQRAFSDIKGGNNFYMPDISDNLCEYDNIRNRNFHYISITERLQKH